MDPTTTCRFTAAHRRAPPPLCAVQTAINTHRRDARTATNLLQPPLTHQPSTASVVCSSESSPSCAGRELVASATSPP
ncbi:hypothetical protein SESBI_44446 [Sesbania bispinosa]|nr:hypothetical protein SESBI_44446 [Sesbania bispinosa]